MKQCLIIIAELEEYGYTHHWKVIIYFFNRLVNIAAEYGTSNFHSLWESHVFEVCWEIRLFRELLGGLYIAMINKVIKYHIIEVSGRQCQLGSKPVIKKDEGDEF
jgi:hypothetical protein